MVVRCAFEFWAAIVSLQHTQAGAGNVGGSDPASHAVPAATRRWGARPAGERLITRRPCGAMSDLPRTPNLDVERPVTWEMKDSPAGRVRQRRELGAAGWC